MGKRRRARELAIQVLFHMEYNSGDPEDCFQLVCDNFDPPEDIRPFSRELVLGVCGHRDELDRLISGSSKNWRLKRMSYVDRNILRIGVFEILFMKDIPPKVSIDEAVELGKIFGREESGSFINGILDHVFNSLEDRDTREKAP
ncbi:MAG: transcription antitermination factor NusB [Desulfatiglandales bacterium]